MSFWDRIYQECYRQNRTMFELAKTVGVSTGYFALARKNGTDPSLSIAFAIAQALHVDLYYLAGEER